MISLFAIFAISPTTAPLLPGITVASLWPTFFFFTATCVVALLFAICCVRETRGMDHEHGITVFGRRHSIIGSIGSIGSFGSIGSTPRAKGSSGGVSGERAHREGVGAASNSTHARAAASPTRAVGRTDGHADADAGVCAAPLSRLASASAPLLAQRGATSLRASSLDEHWGGGRSTGGSPHSQHAAARSAMVQAPRACCAPRASPRRCCRKHWVLRNLTHAVVAADVFAVALLLMSVATDTAQGELLFTSVSSEALFPLMLVVNYILLILFYTRDWWLLVVLWKGCAYSTPLTLYHIASESSSHFDLLHLKGFSRSAAQ